MLVELPAPDQTPQPSKKARSEWIIRSILLIQIGVILFQQITISRYMRTVDTWKSSAETAWSGVHAASKRIEADEAQFVEYNRQIDADRTQLAEDKAVMARGSAAMACATAAMRSQKMTIIRLRRLVELYEPYTRGATIFRMRDIPFILCE